jgi:hypothetical protein
MSIYITNDNGSLTMEGSTKVQINASITIAGTGTELPITIIGEFKDIPPHLHGLYIQAMQSSYGNVNVYDNTKDQEPYSISIPPEILYKKPSRLKTLIFDLYKKIIWKRTNEM